MCGNVNNHTIVVFVLSIPCIAYGYVSGYSTTATETLLKDLKISMYEISWIGSLVPLNATFGSLFVGLLGYRRGRKPLFILCCFLHVTGVFIVAISVNIWMLYLGRSISGFCVGIFCAILPVYVAEILPPKTRGRLSLVTTSSMKLGIFICFSFGMSFNWKTLGWFGFIMGIPFGFVFFIIPESPSWYLNQGQNEMALKVLQWLRNRSELVDDEFNKLVEYHQEQLSQPPFKFTAVFLKQYYKPILTVVALMIFQDWSGFYTTVYYSTAIFKLADSSIDVHLCTLILGLVNVISSLVGAILVDYVGRKLLLCISYLLMFFCLLVLGFHFYLIDIKHGEGSIGWVPLFTLILLTAAHSSGAGPIPWLLMGELLPTKVRTSGSAIVGASSWFFIFCAVKTFVNLEHVINDFGVVWLYATVTIIAFIFTLTFVPETKNIPLQDIERRYINMSSSHDSTVN